MKLQPRRPSPSRVRRTLGFVLLTATAAAGGLDVEARASPAPQSGQWRRVWPAGPAAYVDVAMGSALDGWIAAANGVVRHTTTGGTFWTEQSLATGRLAAIAAKGSLVCAAGDGILRSTDAGQTWNVANPASGLEDVCFVDTQRGWAVGSVGRTFRTIDGGASWSPVPLPGVGATLRAVHFVNANEGWTVGDNGEHWRSQNGGATWTRLPVPTAAHLTDVCFADAARGWIAAGASVLRTLDGGLNWSAVPLPAGARADKLSLLGGQWLWATGTAGVIARSVDGGASWSAPFATAGVPLHDVSMGDLWSGLAVGVDGVVYQTIDGGTNWSLAGGGAPTTTRLAFDVVRRGAKAWASLTDSVILRSTDDGETWTETPAGLPQSSWRAIDFLDDLHGYAVGERQGFYPSTAWTQDGGLTWNPTYWGGMYDFWDVDAVAPGIAVACADNGLWRTTNGGVGWSFVNTTPLSGFFGADFVDASFGVAVGYDVMATFDGGASWNLVITPNAVLRDVAFADGLHGWAVGDGGAILATVDGGNTWNPQPSGTSADLWTVEALSSLTAWAAGTGGAVRVTHDGGASWAPLAPSTGFASDCYGSAFDGPESGLLAAYYPAPAIWKRTPPACSWSHYCQGKTSSNGATPTLDPLGVPSVSQSPLVLRATQAVPGKVGLVLSSQTGPAAIPFAGGLLCVAPPLVRLAPRTFDATGAASWSIDVTPALAGVSRWYQLWQRDPQHPDGTGITLSGGLAVTFCP